MSDDSDAAANGNRSGRGRASDGPTLVAANPERGFNYSYYLAVPESVGEERTAEGASARGDDQRPILVEPHNVGAYLEEFDRHLELARRRIRKQSGRYIADRLGLPILIPVFPRPFEEPVDWTHMIHMLCARTMGIAEGPLERVDRQLLAMVDDARERLAERDISVSGAVALNGFSSQAAFVNRFAALHPGRVCSVSAGGLNGLAILPRETADMRGVGERPMNYPVGVADIEELIGEPFDREAFRELDQFIYMGTEDDKDALLYPDAWTDPELRGIAVQTYGEDIHEERFPHCREVYEEAGVNAVFRMYEGVGHTPEPALDDIVEFHKRSLAGDDIESMRVDLGHTP
jgi:predicted esterase